MPGIEGLPPAAGQTPANSQQPAQMRLPDVVAPTVAGIDPSAEEQRNVFAEANSQSTFNPGRADGDERASSGGSGSSGGPGGGIDPDDKPLSAKDMMKLQAQMQDEHLASTIQHKIWEMDINQNLKEFEAGFQTQRAHANLTEKVWDDATSDSLQKLKDAHDKMSSAASA